MVARAIYGLLNPIPFGISRAALTGNRGEACQHRSLRAQLKQRRAGVLGNVMCNGERAKRRRSFCVDNAFGNALAVEMRVLLEELVILHQQRSTRTGGEAVLVVGQRRTGISSKDVVIWIHEKHRARENFVPVGPTLPLGTHARGT